MKWIISIQVGEEISVFRSAATLVPWRQFWQLAQDPKAVFECACSLLQRTAEAAHVEFKGAKVLDIGCGDRQIAVPHIWQEAQLRVGLDLDLDSLAANGHVDVCVEIYTPYHLLGRRLISSFLWIPSSTPRNRCNSWPS